MVYAVPLSVSDFPSASGEEPNLRFHKPSLISTTGAAPTWSSSGRNARPMTGFTPSNGKKLAEIISAGTRSASPIPVRLKSSRR